MGVYRRFKESADFMIKRNLKVLKSKHLFEIR